MPNKQTPVQKAIKFAKDTYTPTIAEPMIKYLQSLLAEEKEQKKDDWMDGVYGNSEYFDDYFTKTYES